MSPNVNTIAKTLATDSNVGPERAEVFKPFLPKLIEIIEKRGWMNELVTLENLSTVVADFLEHIVQKQPEQDIMGLITDLIEQLRAIVNDRTKYVGDLTDAQILPEQFNRSANTLYKAGKLTISKLLEVNPAMFVPRS